MVSSMGVCVVVCNGCWAAFKTSAVVVGRCVKLGLWRTFGRRELLFLVVVSNISCVLSLIN